MGVTMEKIKKFWQTIPLYSKIVTIVTPILLLAEVVLLFIMALGGPQVNTINGISAVIKAFMWVFIGPVYWKKHKLVSICCFGASLMSIINALFVFLR